MQQATQTLTRPESLKAESTAPPIPLHPPGTALCFAGSEVRVAWYQDRTMVVFPAEAAGPRPENLRYILL